MIEPTQWQETARTLLPDLYRMAMGMLRSDADAQDAVQSTLMKSWLHADRVRPDALRAYMLRILVNECRTLLRRRRRVVPVETVPEAPAPEAGEGREVVEAMAALPDKLRIPLWLKAVESMSEAEGAQTLGVSVGTFRSRVHRARVALRKMLDREVTL